MPRLHTMSGDTSAAGDIAAAAAAAPESGTYLSLIDMPDPWIRQLLEALRSDQGRSAKALVALFGSCRAFRDLILAHCHALVEINLPIKPSAVAAVLSKLVLACKRSPHVRLMLGGASKAPAQFRAPESVNASAANLMARASVAVAGLASVKSVELQDLKLDALVPSWLTSTCPHMTSLILHSCRLTNLPPLTAPVTPCSQLRQLEIRDVTPPVYAGEVECWQHQFGALVGLGSLTLDDAGFLQCVGPVPDSARRSATTSGTGGASGTRGVSGTSSGISSASGTSSTSGTGGTSGISGGSGASSTRPAIGAQLTQLVFKPRPSSSSSEPRFASLSLSGPGPGLGHDDLDLGQLAAWCPGLKELCLPPYMMRASTIVDDEGMEALLSLQHLTYLTCKGFRLEETYTDRPCRWRHLGFQELDIASFDRLPLGQVQSLQMVSELLDICVSSDVGAMTRVAAAIAQRGGVKALRAGKPSVSRVCVAPAADGASVAGSSSLATVLSTIVAPCNPTFLTLSRINPVSPEVLAGFTWLASVQKFTISECVLSPEAWTLLLPSLPSGVRDLSLEDVALTEAHVTEMCVAACRPVTVFFKSSRLVEGQVSEVWRWNGRMRAAMLAAGHQHVKLIIQTGQDEFRFGRDYSSDYSDDYDYESD